MDARVRSWLNRHLFEDDAGGIILPYSLLDQKHPDLRIPSWDEMLTDQAAIPRYPAKLNLLSWSEHGRLQRWQSAIPAWIKESVALFETHQLSLLHYAARYPQLLEVLDQAPVMAWKLVSMPGQEIDLQHLLNGKRSDLMAALGVESQQEGARFLRQLRLRQVSPIILDQIDTCLVDKQRLAGLSQLPRVNSMALALAARFPALIGCRLHRTLAQLPCRPMQCQSMIALLEDVYALAAFLDTEAAEQIGECRYLTDVESLYQSWIEQSVAVMNCAQLQLTSQPQHLKTLAEFVALSRLQYQAWWCDFEQPHHQLWAWLEDQTPVGVLISEVSQPNTSSNDSNRYQARPYQLVRIRQGKNQLPSASLIAKVELWLLNLHHQDL
ncbi:hypothetical protein THIAE_00895 [Thiomicrospira aerophila AL3]|uniref:Uncharacterized protein n=1 Tax=Thiomicrospira aerophila AL3 TaxID=717772 RepID=W0DUE1_9GAMM|nr:hypothetical protein [Thiomicrospira aerophila]AHF00501.1 hypothetical protein THIAE_00895 [Thiomicrospira aerophila AL3]